MNEFGTLAALLAASPARQLRAARGDAEAVLRIAGFRAAMLHVLKTRAGERPLLDGFRRLGEYLRVDMGLSQVERFRVLNLDSRNRLICDDLLGEGSVDRVSVKPRQVLGLALAANAASIVLVHNHPSGDPQPSVRDLDFTRRVAAMARDLEIEMIDHLVVSARGVFSIRSGAMLP